MKNINVSTEDLRILGGLGMLLGLGTWLFPRITAIIGSLAIMSIKIHELEEKPSEKVTEA